ncbi:MAG: 4Fe-4S dicluster domain-containing protein [Deltaproteobacteria bacterium]|nr:4Fe-4S dicluster domain-containing protein [Deltaproteobacteria bacterium]
MNPAESAAICQEFLDSVYTIPHGEKIKECIQCGTCSASCPSSAAMEYGPREIIASLRAGMLDKVLSSNTVWLCVSCYSCTVRCPAAIPFTDVMYELKRIQTEKKVSKDTGPTVMAKSFVAVVDKYGRNHETELLRKYFFQTNPFDGIRNIPLALRLIYRKRFHLRPRKIKGLTALKKMMSAIDNHRKEQP